MLPWLAVSEAVSRSVDSVVSNVNLVKKVVFPLEILPLNVVASALVSEAFAMIVLIGGILLSVHRLPWTVLLLPVILIPQLLLTAGLCWFLASVGVFVRDLGQAVSLLLMGWMFATPIMYPETMIPARFGWVLKINPLALIVSAYRGIFIEGHVSHWKWLAAWGVFAIVFAFVGHAWFLKTKKGFADVI